MSSSEVRKTLPVHVTTLLEKMVERTRQLAVAEGQTIYSQEEDANAIYFIVTGQVKITVVSSSGKEAVLALLGPQEFFLEGCTVGRPSRVRVATAIAPSTLLRIERQALLHAIQDRPELRERLMSAVLLRNMAIEEDLCDQHFNQSEKRLARALLKLARSKNQDIQRDAHIPALRHETLAEMVGTTRPRITRFMAKFRRMGLIDYNRCISNPRFVVRTALLTDRILHNPVNASGGWPSRN
jgi:CRP/FNR family cyclic AMP-dependent transcriptional regulator